jgi:hypothetical protein
MKIGKFSNGNKRPRERALELMPDSHRSSR